MNNVDKDEHIVRNVADLRRLLHRVRTLPPVRLGDVLVRAGVITSRDLTSALIKQAEEGGKPLGEILTEMGLAAQEQVVRALARKFGIPYVRLQNFKNTPHSLSPLPPDLIRQYNGCPLTKLDGQLVVAIENPKDCEALSELRPHIDSGLGVVISSQPALKKERDRYQVRHHQHIFNRLRLLCSLGLPGQMLMPALLRELHQLIPCSCNAFCWLDKQQSISNIYTESPFSFDETVRCLYQLLGPGLSRLPPNLSGWLAKYSGSIILPYDGNADSFAESACAVKTVTHRQQPQACIVLIEALSRKLGLLVLGREPGQPSLSAIHRHLLAELKPIIAQGLTLTGSHPMAFVDSKGNGLLMVDQQGEVRYMSREGGRLLFYATHPYVNGLQALGPPASLCVPDELIRICQNLADGHPGSGPMEVPIWRCENGWGKFIFRTYGLEASSRPSERLIGITVQQQEPLPLKLLHTPAEWQLSPKQGQVAVLWASGWSRKDIAKRLTISPHTVIDHLRKIYHKLEVHGRAQLLDRLVST